MALEAELAPHCQNAVTQKIIAELVGDLANLDNKMLKDIAGDLELGAHGAGIMQ